jgi:hypothetical protein
MTKTATAEKPAIIADRVTKRPGPGPVFVPAGRDALVVRAGTAFDIAGVATVAFDIDTPVLLPTQLSPGADYIVTLINGVLIGEPNLGKLDGALGGFHYAPGGNAMARAGGDDIPAINPFSCWDVGFRPECPDPRGMTLVDNRFWCDIYFLGTTWFSVGSSACGVTIADGGSPPGKVNGGSYRKLDQPTAIEIYAALGKRLLGPEEFFAAAFGVTEGTSLEDDPQTTKLDAPRTSKWGVMQATGNMSTWGTDGDPDGQRQAWRFGGYWGYGEFAGSRYAGVDGWPDVSSEWLGARGRSDHLQPDA